MTTGGRRAHRERPEVYRRRRIVALLLVTAAVLGPCWALNQRDADGDDGGPGLAAGTAGEEQPGVSLDEPSPEGTAATLTDDAPTDDCREAVAALDLRSQLAMLLIVGVSADDPDAVRRLISGDIRPGGIFVRVGTAVWEQRLLADPDERGLPLLVAVDDEGGRVQRLKGVLPDIPSAAEMGTMPPGDVHALAAERAAIMRSLGVDVVFAPVLDLGEGGGIGDRSFGSDPAQVAEHAGAYARGLRDGGILPVVKHFPGEGRASGDPHDGPIEAPGLDLLRAAELQVYDAVLSDGPVGVMVGHLDVPGLTDGAPASLSPHAVGLLRGGYEFDGLVVTDDLVEMRAVTQRFGIPEAVERAIVAGVDMALLANGTDVGAVLDRLVDAVDSGRLPPRRLEGALRRVVAAAGCGV